VSLGVASALLAALEGEARGRGLRALSLSVEVANDSAMSRYRRREDREVTTHDGGHTMLLTLCRPR